MRTFTVFKLEVKTVEVQVLFNISFDYMYLKITIGLTVENVKNVGDPKFF